MAVFWRAEFPVMMTKKSVKVESPLRSRTTSSSAFLARLASTERRTSRGMFLLLNRGGISFVILLLIQILSTDIFLDRFRDKALDRQAKSDPAADFCRGDIDGRYGEKKDTEFL